MRLSEKVQYGMLFCLYLCRAGRATTKSAAENMNLSQNFLEQVSRKLRLAGIVKSIRGANGGYELLGNPQVLDIFTALAPVRLLNSYKYRDYATGGLEKRALMAYVSGLNQAIFSVMNKEIRTLNKDVVTKELLVMNNLDTTVLGN